MYGRRHRMTHSDSESSDDEVYPSHHSHNYDSYSESDSDDYSDVSDSDMSRSDSEGEESERRRYSGRHNEGVETALEDAVIHDDDEGSRSSESDDDEGDALSFVSHSDAEPEPAADEQRVGNKKERRRYVSDSDSDDYLDNFSDSGSESERVRSPEVEKRRARSPRFSRSPRSSESGDEDGDAHFTEAFLMSFLKTHGISRDDFDITAFMLYVSDLAAFMYLDEANDRVAFRVARYINSVFPKRLPMGADLEGYATAINAMADLIGSCEEVSLLERTQRVGAKVDGGLPKGERPSAFALSLALPLVLSHAEGAHSDVVAIVRAAYSFVSISEPSVPTLLYPLEDSTQIDEIYDALSLGEEANAIKLFQTYRAQQRETDNLPVGLALPMSVFEDRVRELGRKKLGKVTRAIPIEGPDVEAAYDEEWIETATDTQSESFARGEPLAVTLDDIPNSESAFYHLKDELVSASSFA